MAGFYVEGAAEPAAPSSASMRAADPALIARYRLVASREPDTARPAPVRAEIVRFDQSAPIRFPAAIAERLAQIRVTEAAPTLRAAE